MEVKKAFAILSTIILILLISTLVLAQSGRDIRVLKISPRENAAVVEYSRGQLQLIRTGDFVADFGRVITIAPGRIVFEQKNQGARELLVIRLSGGQQKLERISKALDEKPALLSAPPAQNKAEKSN